MPVHRSDTTQLEKMRVARRDRWLISHFHASDLPGQNR
jgi:hypothetical protein